MTADLHILQHALGVDKYGRGNQFRRHFVTGPGSIDYPTCVDLVARGLMEKHRPSELTGGDDLFLVTPAGRDWMAANSPSPPKLTRGQRRYRRYLEAGSSLSFGEWLKLRVPMPDIDPAEIPF